MLSRVLSGLNTAVATAAVFPHFASEQVSTRAQQRADGKSEDKGAAELREQLARAEAQRATASREAFESGFRQGEEKARAEIKPVIDRLNAAINEITSLRPEMRRRAERDTVQLALLIAKRILHRDLAVDEEALNAIARVAFERLTRAESYTLTVHPRFAQAITAALPAGQSSRVRIESDPGCEPGTLVIRSAEGSIDASIDTQLEEISRGLTDRLSQST